MPAPGKSSRTAVARMCAAEWRSTSSASGSRSVRIASVASLLDAAGRGPGPPRSPARPRAAGPARARSPRRPARARRAGGHLAHAAVGQGQADRRVIGGHGPPARPAAPTGSAARCEHEIEDDPDDQRARPRAASGPARQPRNRTRSSSSCGDLRSENASTCDVARQRVNLTACAIFLHEDAFAREARNVWAAAEFWPGRSRARCRRRGRASACADGSAGSTPRPAGRTNRAPVREPARRVAAWPPARAVRGGPARRARARGIRARRAGGARAARWSCTGGCPSGAARARAVPCRARRAGPRERHQPHPRARRGRPGAHPGLARHRPRRMTEPLAPQYNPAAIERALYHWWQSRGPVRTPPRSGASRT